MSECDTAVLNQDVCFVPVLKDWHRSSICLNLPAGSLLRWKTARLQSGAVGFDLALNCWLISNSLMVFLQRYQSRQKGQGTEALFTSGALICSGTECLQNKSSQTGQP